MLNVSLGKVGRLKRGGEQQRGGLEMMQEAGELGRSLFLHLLTQWQHATIWCVEFSSHACLTWRCVITFGKRCVSTTVVCMLPLLSRLPAWTPQWPQPWLTCGWACFHVTILDLWSVKACKGSHWRFQPLLLKYSFSEYQSRFVLVRLICLKNRRFYGEHLSEKERGSSSNEPPKTK